MRGCSERTASRKEKERDGAGRGGEGGKGRKKKRGDEKRGELNDVSHTRSFGRAGDASVWVRTGSELQ
jgi:hypothetical protein